MSSILRGSLVAVSLLAASAGNADQTPPSSPGLHFAADNTDGPTIARAAAQQVWLRQYRFDNRFNGTKQEDLNPAPLQATPPVPVFLLSLEDLAHGRRLENVQSANGYIYIFDLAGKPAASIETIVDRSGAAAISTASAYGLQDNHIVQPSFEKLMALDQVHAGSFEVRLLRLPPEFNVLSDFLTIFWLKSAASGTDIIYLSGQNLDNSAFPQQFRPLLDTPYAVDDFFRLVQPMAQQKLDALPKYVPGNTTENRLDNLQSALQNALDAFNQVDADPDAEFVAKAIAGVNQTLADVAKAREYLKAHPEANPLPVELPPPGVPGVEYPGGMINLTQSSVAYAYPTLRTAMNSLVSGLTFFLNGIPAGAVVGKIGGYRDAILHDLGQTSSGLMVEINNLPRGQSDSPADVTASEDAAKNPGSISGLVVDTDGDPAADVLIGLTPDPEMRSRSEVDEKVIYPAGMPRTVTDENGAFTISGLPPGIYIITGSLNSPHSPLYLAGVPRWIADDWRMDGSVSFVEVKAGAETKLPKPMELMGL